MHSAIDIFLNGVNKLYEAEQAKSAGVDPSDVAKKIVAIVRGSSTVAEEAEISPRPYQDAYKQLSASKF